MTNFQKIIKYAAIVFGVYLCFMIIGFTVFILTVIFGITTGFEKIESNYHKNSSAIVNKWEQEYSKNSRILQKADIECGIGKLDLNLIGLPIDYKIKTETGLGHFEVNGQKVSDHQTIGDGKATVKIEAGMGEVIVDFKQLEGIED